MTNLKYARPQRMLGSDNFELALLKLEHVRESLAGFVNGQIPEPHPQILYLADLHWGPETYTSNKQLDGAAGPVTLTVSRVALNILFIFPSL